MQSTTSTQDPLADFVPLDEYQKQHSDKLTKTQLKWLARSRDTNGLSKCGAMVTVSRKLYIHKAKFAQCEVDPMSRTI